MIRTALVVLRKDLRLEWRTRESAAGVVSLVVLFVVVFSTAFDPRPEEAPALAPAVMWATFVFTGVLGVQRGFVVERENDCLAGILVAPVDPAGLYVGKVAANVLLLAATQALVVPLVGILLHADVLRALLPLLVVLVLGNLGFAALATLFAAIAVRIRAREVILPALLMPLLVPVLIAGVKATEAVLAGGGLAAAREAVAVLAAFDVIVVVAGFLLFEYVVRD